MTEFEDEWTRDEHESEQARLRRDLGDELELLDDHKNVRIGDRFGFTLCIGDPDGGHHYKFHDAGPWLPPQERPAEARPPWDDDIVELYGPQPTVAEQPITHDEYYEWLVLQDEENWRRASVVFRVVMQAAHREIFPVLMEMRQWLAEQDPLPAPVLTVRCSSAHRGRPCRVHLATVWQTGYGLYGTTVVAPSQTAGEVLAGWGDPEHIALTGQDVPHEFSPEDVDEGVDDLVPMACRFHGNVEVRADLLVTEAHSTRRTLNVDAMSKGRR